MSNLFLDFTPKHVRAARALLDWTQQDLAKHAEVSTSTITDFERGKRKPVANNAQAIRSALEKAGVRFLPAGAVVDPSIPLTKAPEHSRRPVRWVNAEDLIGWAPRQDSVASLPILLSRLVYASGPAVRYRFPSDEGIRQPGWDGFSQAEQPHIYVPQGETGWEITGQRSNITQKATEDYEKRTADPAGLNAATSTFIFVTLRHWPQKDTWIKARQSEKRWREVRVYDVNDLVHWIEQSPAVGLWIAHRLNKRPDGIRELDECWNEWSQATRWPLTKDLVLCDRNEDAVAVLRWLRAQPAVFSIQTTTTGEAVSFFHAMINSLPSEEAAHYRTRCLVATNAAAARALIDAPAPLILVLTEPEPGLARSLSERGHFVLQTYDESPVSSGEIRRLARPSREGIAEILINAGVPQAQGLARDCARNLAVLRRLIPAAPDKLPTWAQEPPRELLAALIAGAWDEGKEGDRNKLSELSGKPYDQITAALTRYVGEFDSPLRQIGSGWRVASPLDAWMLLSRYLTAADLDRFAAVANAVLGSKDPRYDMKPEDRWMASVRGIDPKYSELLRHGIGEILVLLATRGKEIRGAPDPQRRVDQIVRKLLRDADRPRWWSLSQNFRLLAEAAPGTFLDAIEDSLDQNDPTIRVLSEREEGGMLGQEYLSDLLWALETLAWSPNLLPRVTLVLAGLDAIDDPIEGAYTNRPANSLCQIYQLWRPQTHASFDQRLRALDLIRKRQNNVAWKMMLELLPHHPNATHDSPVPRWRNFGVDQPEAVTDQRFSRGVIAISERLLSDVGTNAGRWLTLLDCLRGMVLDVEKVLAALEVAEPKIKGEADRASLWQCLRQQLHHHRQFANISRLWSEDQLCRLECIHERFGPTDPLKQVEWLFKPDAAMPHPSHEGWQAKERQIEDAKRKAAQTVFTAHGRKGIFDLAKVTAAGRVIGKALFEIGLPEADLDDLLETALRSSDVREREVARGLMIPVFRKRKEPWADALIAQAGTEKWGDEALLAILRALPQKRWVWDRVAQAGKEIETAYWRDTSVRRIGLDAADIAYAAQKLLSVGHPHGAVDLIGYSKMNSLPSDLLTNALQEAASQSGESDNDATEPAILESSITAILTELHHRADVDQDTLAHLEWTYLPFLRSSDRPAKILSEKLSKDSSFFVDVLCRAYKPHEESGVDESASEDPEHARHIAEQAYRLLDQWNRLPGSQKDGTIDGRTLEAWIKKARLRAKEVGRADIADHWIGHMLSASPMGADDHWPTEAVREAIDLFRSEILAEGFQAGKFNRRGVTERPLQAGGILEREEAVAFRQWAQAINYEHPYTAKALHALADDYEQMARRYDEDTERRNQLR